MKKIRWNDLRPRGAAFHSSYATRPTGRSWDLHGHDFCEVFWVDSGIGLHVLQGGEEPGRLVAGQVCFIRERDAHGFEPLASHEPFGCINIAFPTRAWHELRTRYHLEHHPFLNDSAPGPPVLEAPSELHGEFSSLFHRVLRRTPHALSRDAFLLALAERTGTVDQPTGSDRMPAWLRRGMLAMENDPESWGKGSSALARHCGCSRTHLARVFQSHLGKTPSDWIMDLRLTRAARLLINTGFSVTEVAIESGFENLSHFHRRFLERHRQTPLRFRKARHRPAF